MKLTNKTQKFFLCSLGFSLIALTLSACGKKRPDTAHFNRPDVPQSYTGIDSDSQGDQSVNSGNEPISACVYWDSLVPVFKETPIGTFQYLESFQIGTDDVKGAFNLLTLPQARFALSYEYNNGNPAIPNVWNFLDFYMYASKNIADKIAVLEKEKSETSDEARKEQIKNEIAALQKDQSNLDKAKDYPWIPIIRPREKALVARNAALTGKIESSIPGALSGNPGSLAKSPLFGALIYAIGLEDPDFSVLQSGKTRLTKRVPLFAADDWNLRRLDMQRALSSLTTENEGNNTPQSPQEKLCRFLVSQRMMAQLLNLKGMTGAPSVTATGRLAPLPTAWDVPLNYGDVRSTAYEGAVINEAWLGQQLAPGNVPPRMVGAESTEQHLEAMRFWLALASHRLPTTWQTTEKPTLGTLNVSPALLKLSFGVLGLHLGIFKASELKLEDFPSPTNGFLSLREDSPDNLARLIYLSRETMKGLRGLSKPNDFGNALLGKQIVLFTHPKDGVLVNFSKLVIGSIAEGALRIRAGIGSPTLNDALKAIGRP